MQIPIATYRIQTYFGQPLGLILRHVNYFQQLGISHLYLSPLLAAAVKSPHGYDVVDFTRINPEVGHENELQLLASELRKRNMGIILDFVPNHMCVTSPLNRWWWSVLKEGQTSHYAHFFDIDWSPPATDLSNKILLPFLDETAHKAYKQGQCTLRRENGEEVLVCGEMRFPYQPKAQHYQLDHWRRGNQDLNYRRFFNISELACIRMEDPEVFEKTHAKISEWIEKKWIDGLRLDHIDGLYNPKQYLTRLREKWPDFYIIVEKILEEDEKLPEDWNIQGTTGYDFLNLLNGIFVYIDHHKNFQDLYDKFLGQPIDFNRIIKESKRYILFHDMSAERKRICREFTSRLPQHPKENIEEAVTTLIIHFPIYRTYLPEHGKETLSTTFALARRDTPIIKDSLWGALEYLFWHDQDLTKKFQQVTGPIMAKGFEDTALYRYCPLVSLNEVGGNPNHFGISLQTFHKKNQERQKKTPFSLSTTTTHDTKRSEDVRARLNVLSEMPQEWQAKIQQWHEWNHPFKTDDMPSKHDEYLLYQTIVGTWLSEQPHEKYVERIQQYMLKAIREEKKQTGWIDPNIEYERATSDFVANILMPDTLFYQDCTEFVSRIIEPGFYNALAQMVIKITAPGIPDFYQGTEDWCLTLVDPDNRKDVNFDSLLHASTAKMKVMQKALECRSRHIETFQQGDYIPLKVTGEYHNHIIAFCRAHADDHVVTLCGRFFTLLPENMSWKDTAVHLPSDREYSDLFTNRTLSGSPLYVRQIFDNLPIAILEEK